MRRVGIVAVAQTKYESAKPGHHFSDLIYEPVRDVLEKTGLKFTDDGTGIDFTVSASSDHWDGWTIAEKNVTDVAGGHLRAEEKVDCDGAYAFFYAVLGVLGGHYDSVLVLSHLKESGANGRLIENFGIDHVYTQMLGLDFLSGAGLQATRYMKRFGINREQAALVAVKNRSNASFNPYAQASGNYSVEDVLNSRVLSYPITELDSKPASDGACALIIATEEKARKWTDKPIWVDGMGNCHDSQFLGDRELSESPALEKAAKTAYKMAGISDPTKEIDLFEISEYFSYQELLWSEGLGLCDKGGGGKLVESGKTQINGSIPINPSGGLLSGVPVYVAGLNRIVEAAIQLRGEGGKRQVPDARVALAHGCAGVCGQMHCVIVLRRGF
ncbi:MAG: thiolase family protein [Candidatus Bathyarchaeia archaeon]